MKRNVHVVYHSASKDWQVKLEHETEPVAVFATKDEAFEKGREVAKAEQSELLVHNMDGVISEKLSYGNDPRGVHG